LIKDEGASLANQPSGLVRLYDSPIQTSAATGAKAILNMAMVMREMKLIMF
jgi:hypothetical protein